jgi:hypothetical protein
MISEGLLISPYIYVVNTRSIENPLRSFINEHHGGPSDKEY